MMLAYLQNFILIIVEILVFHAADNLLDHIGHGNDAGRAAMLVNHHGDFRYNAELLKDESISELVYK